MKTYGLPLLWQPRRRPPSLSTAELSPHAGHLEGVYRAEHELLLFRGLDPHSSDVALKFDLGLSIVVKQRENMVNRP